MLQIILYRLHIRYNIYNTLFGTLICALSHKSIVVNTWFKRRIPRCFPYPAYARFGATALTATANCSVRSIPAKRISSADNRNKKQKNADRSVLLWSAFSFLYVSSAFSLTESHSNSIVETGFSEISHATRLTPGTVAIIRSRMAQRVANGISGTVAVTASTVLTARITTSQPI